MTISVLKLKYTILKQLLIYGFETFVTYTLYGNFGSEVRMILKVTFDLQKYTQNND